MIRLISLWTLMLLMLAGLQIQAAEPLQALIIEGQNNHGVWPKTTKMMKRYLVETKLFQVDVATTAKKGTDPSFSPKFSKYSVVISNYNGAA